MVLLSIVHLGSIAVTLSSAIVLGVQTDRWALGGVTFGFGTLDLIMALLITVLVLRKKQAMSRAMDEDGDPRPGRACLHIQRAIVAINMIGMLLHQLPMLFIHGFAVLALRRDDAIIAWLTATTHPDAAAAAAAAEVGSSGSWVGSDSATVAGDSETAATAAAQAWQLNRERYYHRDGAIGNWGWGADTPQALLWASFTLAASALALGFVLLEVRVATWLPRPAF